MKNKLQEKLELNAIAGERLDKLTADEKQITIKNLNKTYSFRELEKLTGIPHTTLASWATKPKEPKIKLHMGLDKLVEFFKDYKVNPKDIPILKELHTTIGDLINESENN